MYMSSMRLVRCGLGLERVARSLTTSCTVPFWGADLKAAIALIEKGVAKKEMRLMARAIRQMLAVRRRLKASTVSSFLNYALPSGSEALSRLLGFVAKVRQQPA